MAIRMRTIGEAAAELKGVDPSTAVTPHAIRRMVLTGEIPHVKVGAKRLINLDFLLEYLASAPEPKQAPSSVGAIRPIQVRGMRS